MDQREFEFEQTPDGLAWSIQCLLHDAREPLGVITGAMKILKEIEQGQSSREAETRAVLRRFLIRGNQSLNSYVLDHATHIIAQSHEILRGHNDEPLVEATRLFGEIADKVPTLEPLIQSFIEREAHLHMAESKDLFNEIEQVTSYLWATQSEIRSLLDEYYDVNNSNSSA